MFGSTICGPVLWPGQTRRHWVPYAIAAILLPLRLVVANDFSMSPGSGAGGFVWNVSTDGAVATANPVLNLIRGHAYTFHVAGLAGFHSFYIKTVSSAGSANAYGGAGLSDNGIGADTTPGEPIIFDVPQDAPDRLFYDCGAHLSMAGEIDIAIFTNGFD